MKKLIILILAAMMLTSCAGRGGKPGESGSDESKTTGTTNVADIPIEQALVVPEGEIRNEIEKALADAFSEKEKIEWADPADFPRIGVKYRCYGIFNGCAVIFSCSYQLPMEETKTVAGHDFFVSYRFNLYGCKDGVIYSLEEAYNKGFITEEEVGIAAERHLAVESRLQDS